ncbi:Ral GTPase-activating protein subunit alpha-1 [Hypsibius exemplaris]|uniref:Ral GTPase-activating protein subunit alpha-1 n=1 Tax=Hypsibius exemplaris TaxID=2072580 RepID=A0A1W0WY42_HYPEX|nr:Ral GTPase-activating protein subunit alpha-1 [Hypsibius exemplaris]
MFKARNSDLQKSLSKLSDGKKDLKTRFRHLKVILDHKDPVESKKVLSEDPEEVFRVFTDNFHALDQSLKQKGQKVSKEDVENVLSSLERILILIPEYIRGNTDHNIVISTVLKRCLHPSSTLRIRRDAMRPFLIYYQILRDSSGDDLHQLFLALVPGLLDHNSNGQVPRGNAEEVFQNTPPLLLPPVTEKLPEHIARFMYETLIDLLVSQVFRIQWDLQDQFQISFSFLFDKFKLGYLSRVFPYSGASWSPLAGAPPPSSPSRMRLVVSDPVIFSLQVATLKWIVTFLQSPENLKSDLVFDPHKKRLRDNSTTSDSIDAPHTGRITRDNSATGFTAAMQNLLHFDVGVGSAQADGKLKQNYGSNVYLLVRHILLSSPLNVQLVHELFETAFRFPVAEFAVIRRVVGVYQTWILSSEALRNTPNGFQGSDVPDTPHRPTTAQQSVAFSSQSALKLFCTNSVPAFTTEIVSSDTSAATRGLLLDEQEDVCKRIVTLYRLAITHVPMSLSTWECILSTLIRITQTLMPSEPPKDRLSTLCGRLAMPLFQTLLNAWVKGTLSACISHKLWDELTAVLSTLTGWDELIVRWEKTLELITRMFAAEVFEISSESEQGHSNSSASPLNNGSDDGTLTATVEVPRSRSSASSDADQFPGFLLSSSLRSETSGTDSGSITEVPEDSDEREGAGKSDTLKAGEDMNSVNRRLLSDEQTEEIRLHFAEMQSASRPSSTPDSMRGSLNSPLFYPLSEADRNRASSVSSFISVMAGGPMQGWSPDSTCALWFRVFGVIGPVNGIRHPASHKFTLQSVKRITDMLHTIQLRTVSTKDASRSLVVPAAEKFAPVSVVAPLLLETMDLDERYQPSQVLALSMLLHIAFHCEKINRKFLSQFFRVLHRTLLSDHPLLIEVVLSGAGMRLLCCELPNAILLLEDIVASTSFLLNSPLPALQLTAVRLLTSILFFLTRLPAHFSAFAPVRDSLVVRQCERSHLEDKIRGILLQYTNVALAPTVRIPALYAVGATLLQLLEDDTAQFSTVEQFLDKVLRSVENYAGEGATEVVNILLILSNNAKKLAQLNCVLVVNIVEVVCRVLQRITTDLPNAVDLSKDLEEMVIKLVFCLCEWATAVPAVLSLNLSDNKLTLLSLLEKTLEGLLTLTDPVVRVEQEDHLLRPPEDVKGKGKRAFSDHLLFDRRYSTDVGHALTGKAPVEEEPISTRRTTMFGRPVPEPVKEKEKKPPVPLIDLRTQAVFSQGRFRTLRLAAAYAARHVVNLFQAFTDAETYASPSSLVFEEDSVPTGALLDSLQTFALYDLIITVIKLDKSESHSDEPSNPLLSAFPEFPGTRLIVRDISGKFCYDLISLFGPRESTSRLHSPGISLMDGQPASLSNRLPDRTHPDVDPADQTLERLKACHSDDVVLDILKYVDATSPDLGVFYGRDWREAGPPPPGLTAAEESAGAALMDEQFVLMEECVMEKTASNARWAAVATPEPFSIPDAVFGYCSRFLSQFGYAGMAKRQHCHLLNRTDDLFRDLKLLDRRANRDTHKIAVIYVGRGQEDKMSIMTNSAGSAAYERFVARLGWPVAMSEHKGFRGGLPQNSRQFGSAVYFASATVEVIFHVATRVSALSSEEHTSKMRHIGNDEVQIVWSDHYEDYERRHMPTQFGDVIICIYPTHPTGLYRIQILQRGHIPQFGPLFDGAVVDEQNLAGLVRNTALFAGRACRKQIKGYQYFFEERADYIRSLIHGHSLEGSSTYESFFASIISPQTPKLQIPSVQLRDLGASLRPTWRESQRRYKERAKSALQQRSSLPLVPSVPSVPRERGAATPAVGNRHSIPLQLGNDASATDV